MLIDREAIESLVDLQSRLQGRDTSRHDLRVKARVRNAIHHLSELLWELERLYELEREG